MPPARRLTRKAFLRTSSATAAGVLVGPRAAQALAAAGAGGAGAGFLKGRNVVIFITDQERAIQHFPRGWEAKNLPGLARLKRNGVTFENAFTNACMCSPARSTLLSGLLPAQHGVRHTLEANMPADQFPQVQLSRELKNLATVMTAAGYETVWKGKFHCGKAADPSGTWKPSDVGRYGFKRWNPKDAGANQSLPEGGGGDTPGAGNDRRYMGDDGDMATGHEGVLAYLRSVARRQRPFCLVVSLVNPHDVLFYPKNFAASGYPASTLQGEIDVPETVDEDLGRKPQAQAAFKKLFAITGEPTGRQQQRAYLNFYANLMKTSDAHLVDTLDTLRSTGLLDDTVIIRTADHGEMGLAHGGLRQKNFNIYEETMRVPLVFSNAKLFPKAVTTPAMVSHVDFLPTMATLFGAPAKARSKWNGVDYSRLVADPKGKPVQDHVVFTYEDFQSGQPIVAAIPQPNHIASIRETRWKLAQYYDPSGTGAKEWELYDLQSDPLERQNLAEPGHRRTAAQDREFARLKARLAVVRRTRLQPRPTQHTMALTAMTKQTARTGLQITDQGSLSGAPTGVGSITLDWVLNAVGTATASFHIASGAGDIRGTIKATFVVTGDDIAFTGTADLTSGTGTFAAITATGLAFSDKNTVDGQNGVVTLSGPVRY